MIVERAEHPTWTSNAYLVADGTAATACSSTRTVSRSRCSTSSTAQGIEITHVLVTHGDMDHVVRVDELGARSACRSCAAVRHEPIRSGDARDTRDPDAGARTRPLRAPRERHGLPHRRLPLQGNGRRDRERRAGRLREPGRLDHEQADVAAARDAHPSRPHAAVDDRRGVGAKPVHPHLARRRPGRHRGVPRAREGRRRSSSSARTTTGRTRPGCATRTGATRSSAAAGSNEAEARRYTFAGAARTVASTSSNAAVARQIEVSPAP